MAKTAKQLSWETTAFQAAAQSQEPLQIVASNTEDDAPSPFITDLAERLANICVERHGSQAMSNDRAVPLARNDTRDDLRTQALPAAPGKAPAETFAVVLYTSDGNMRSLEEIEADVIRLAICRYRGRMSEVARRLNIGRSTLYRKLSDLGIDHTDYRAV